MEKKAKGPVLLGIGDQGRKIQNAKPGVAIVINVQRQKDICMGKSEMDICPFSYWRARQGNSECTGKFHQSPETQKKSSVEARALSRLELKNKSEM